MYKKVASAIVVFLFLFSSYTSAYQWSGGGIAFRLSVSGGKSDAFILLSTYPLDYVQCLDVNWSEDLASQCSVTPSFYQTYVFYFNHSGIFLVGRYLDPVWFFYSNRSWIMVRTKDYKHRILYRVVPSKGCYVPLNRTIIGQGKFEEIIRRSTVKIGGRAENGTVIFKNWSIPARQFRPYLWLNKELHHLTAVPLEGGLLIYPPTNYWVLLRKNGSFTLFSHPSSEIYINGTLPYLKPVTVFLYDGKTLRAFPFYHVIYEADLKRQTLRYVEGFCVRGNINLTPCPAVPANSTTITTPISSAGTNISSGETNITAGPQNRHRENWPWILIVLVIIGWLLFKRSGGKTNPSGLSAFP
ncbi:hypothetical protein [Thermococcus sp.]